MPKAISDLVEEALRREFPWLTEADIKGHVHKSAVKPSSAGISGSSGASGARLVQTDAEVDVHAMVAELNSVRSMFHNGEDCTFFLCTSSWGRRYM